MKDCLLFALVDYQPNFKTPQGGSTLPGSVELTHVMNLKLKNKIVIVNSAEIYILKFPIMLWGK